MADADDQLAATAGELADVLADLRAELERSRRRGPLGLPAPPRPGELLRFADEFAIPFAIAVLEANVRALELLQGGIRLGRSGERAGTEARAARDRAVSFSRTTLEQLDAVLGDLETALGDGALPRNEEARTVLTEARDLRAELDQALADATDRGASAGETAPDESTAGAGETDIPVGPEEDLDEALGRATVDVEGELASIKAELDRVEEEGFPDESEPVGDEGAPADGDGAGSAADEGDGEAPDDEEED